MLVKEIVALAAHCLGREDLYAAAKSLADRPKGELFALLRCYNLVENEIALEYIPLKREEVLSVENGFLPFYSLSSVPVHIKRITDEGGNPMDFTLLSDGIKLRGKADRVTVLYDYSPVEKGWNDQSEYGGKVSARLMAEGTAGEFCLTNGQFSEAAAWDQKYRDALRSAYLVRKKLKIRPRRWV